MNKNNWITCVLDDKTDVAELHKLLQHSYDVTEHER